MALPNRHIIHRKTLSVELYGRQDGYALQQELSRLVWERLRPVLVDLFDQFAGPEELIRIDRLEIDLGRVDPDQLEKELVKKVRETLEEQLYEKIKLASEGTVDRQPLRRRHFEHWLAFLQSGVLPWASTFLSSAELEAQILAELASSAGAGAQLRRLLTNSLISRRRLVLQHGDVFLIHLLETFTAREEKALILLKQEWRLLLHRRSRWMKRADLIEKTEPSAPLTMSQWFWDYLLEEVVIRGETVAPLRMVHALWVRSFPMTLRSKDPVRIRRLAGALVRHLRRESAEFTVLFRLLEEKGEKVLLPVSKGIDTTKREAPRSLGDAAETAGTDPPDESDTKDEAGKAETTESKSLPDIPSQKEDDSHSVLSEKEPKPAEEIETGEEPRTQEPFEREFPDTPAEQRSPEKEAASYFVRNAGLVLLHPHLPRLFRNLDLLEGKKFREEAARHRAVHLLHWLATGQEGAPEYDMLLAKHLCAMPFEAPLEREIELEEREKQDCYALLEAVIGQWTALKHTSLEGLRQGFLQRDGKLERRSDGWRLRVEQRTMDILIDRLPWSISLIKLPWMPEMLAVEWV